MTQDRNPSTIEVSVNVKVTLPGGAGVEVSVPHVQGLALVRPLDASDPITVIKPPVIAGVRTAQVGFDSCTNGWYICATGQLNASACCVLAKVYPGSAVFSPGDPPPVTDATLRCTPVFTSYGVFCWQFVKPRGNLLPVPAPVGSGNTNYILAIWVKFDGQTDYTFLPVPFVGVQSTHTDCDGGAFDGPRPFPVRFGMVDPGAAHPPLIGVVREKGGRFAALPGEGTFAWDAGEGGWVWVPPAAQCGTFTLAPSRNTFVLHSTAAEPHVFAPRPGGSTRPLQLTFEVHARAGKSAKADKLVLDVREAGGPPSEDV